MDETDDGSIKTQKVIEMNNNIRHENELSEPEDDSAEQLLNEWLGELDTLTGVS